MALKTLYSKSIKNVAMNKIRYIMTICGIVAACLASVCACKVNQSESSNQSKGQSQDNQNDNVTAAQQNARDAVVVVHSDNFDVTLGDYRRCVAVHALEGRVFSKRALANPNFQRDEAMRCTQSKILREYAEKNNVHPTSEAIEAMLRKYIAKAEVQTEYQLAEKIGYPVEKLRMIVEDAMRLHTLQAYFVHQLSYDAQKKMFKTDYRRYSVDWLTFNNEVSDEITHKYMNEHSDELAAVYAQNKRKFMSLPKAEFIRFAFPLNGDELNDGLAFQDANKLKVEAVRNGEAAAIAFCEKHEECKVSNGPEQLYIAERTEENKWAFRSPIGTVSDVQKEDRSCEVLILKNIIPPKEPDMKNEETRFGIAKKLLSDKVPDERILIALKDKLVQPDVDVRSVTKGLGGLYRFVENARFMDLTNEDKIPSKIVREALKTLTDKDVMLFSDPLVENSKIQIFRARSVIEPKDEDFDAKKDEWIEQKSNDAAYSLVMDWLEENTPKMTAFNIHALEDAYGVLQPNGSIL